jgi:hypothetical protein
MTDGSRMVGYNSRGLINTPGSETSLLSDVMPDVDMSTKKTAIHPKQICHLERSEAQWRDLRFHRISCYHH